MGQNNSFESFSRYPVKIAEDIYWVGYPDKHRKLTDNPYLVKNGEEGIIIDGGSRPDFPNVMMKIMQTGMSAHNISTLIYQHYDPDLCGSITNLEQIIDNPDLKIISQKTNNLFIRHYGVKSELMCIDDLGGKIELSSGRTLHFYKTPYSHSAGSFITHDVTTRTLFTSDLFGSICSDLQQFELFRKIPEECGGCADFSQVDADFFCRDRQIACPVAAIHKFQKELMTSNKAFRYALDIIRNIDASIIAPQHGFVITDKEDFDFIYSRLLKADDIGIDGFLKGEKNEV
ncbi:MAG: MBL fold metallo-hydrolase [Desulfovibrionales bacterium]